MQLFSRYPTPSITGLFSLVFLIIYFATTSGGYDSDGHVIGRDFLNTHLGGVLINQGQSEFLFQPDSYWDEVKKLHGPDYKMHNWSYPPLLWPVSQALALLPYFWAYAVWNLLGVGLVFLAVRVLGLRPIWGLFICLSPAGFWNIYTGQNGFIFSSLMVMALALTYRQRHALAGLGWAALAIKPHLGVCVIPLLFCKRKFRVIAWGALFLGLGIAGTILAYGADAWRLFFQVTASQQTMVVETWQGAVKWMMPSGFMQGRLIGLETGAAYTLHLVIAAVGAVLLYLRWPGREAPLRTWMLWLVLGTLILLPYLFSYDMVMLQFALAMWFDRQETLAGPRLAKWHAGVFRALWLLPWLGNIFAGVAAVQITPFVLLALLAITGAMRDRGAETPGQAG